VLNFTTSKSEAWNTLNVNENGPAEPDPANGPAFLFSLEIVIGMTPERLLKG
jgi:hypothetical protein